MLTINEILKTLREVEKPYETKVYFDFASCVPSDVDSWRGIYAEPAIGWDAVSYSNAPTVEKLIAELEKAIDGRTYLGWKGGEYSYNGDQTLHVDNSGEYTSTEISRVEVKDYCVIFHTYYNN